jgi:hypothetical protein
MADPRRRSGRALTAAIGSGKGTVDLNDWEQADAIWLMGDNAATNASRMLTWLAEADRRGAQLVHINPLSEAASRRTIVPHEFVWEAAQAGSETGERTQGAWSQRCCGGGCLPARSGG